jgi:predicted glycosyltransferase
VNVFFYVQHLLGIGHLKRAATLAQAMRAAGFEVTLASGGEPVAGIPVLQLPPAKSDASFKTLYDEHGKPVDDAWKARRTRVLVQAFEKSKPDVLLVELFPFGRRQMRFELLPLLEAARQTNPRPLVVCSVRDLLQPNPAREDEALERFERYYDKLLVHGDPRLAPFERSFGSAARLAGELHYTGYVVEDMPTGDAGKDEVLVSAGGGAVGRRLLETAIEARPLTALRGRTWRILAGVNAAEIETLKAPGLIVERARPDFTVRLRNCVLSVSQAGYNTVMETLQARARGVLVPYAAGVESEQTLRAKLLAGKGLVEMVEESALSAASLAAAIDRAAADDAVFIPDVGTPTLWAARYLSMNGLRRLIGSFNHGTMANALPHAIGAQAAQPGRQVIALSGDGGLAMLLGELLTVKTHRLPVKVVVFNNSSLGMVRLEMLTAGDPPFETDHDAVDYAAIAAAMGFHSRRVTEPGELRAAVAETLGHDGPALLDVVTTADALEVPTHITLEEARGFALALGRTVLSGGVGRIAELARQNLRNIPH